MSIRIQDLATDAPKDLDKGWARDQVKDRSKAIAALHELLVAEGKHSVLVIFQGMDGSGKDGATRNVFGDCAHFGLRTVSFKKPTDEEFAHDFLWRVHKQAPEKGELVIFNRSHYEDVLIQRVHGWIDEERVKKRMAAINAFEQLLAFDNNTLILKFFLHISKEQQEIELRQRMEENDKYWKHNANDWKEREYWPQYMAAYEDILNQSSIPWHPIAVDQRWYRDYLISGIVLDALKGLNMQWPPLNQD